MKNFFFLEGAYLILGAIILLITVFVATRPFMEKGALKKGLFWVTAGSPSSFHGITEWGTPWLPARRGGRTAEGAGLTRP